MKPKMKPFLNPILLLLFLTTVITSCIQEMEYDQSGTKDEATVTFSIEMPALAKPTTRSGQTTAETLIKNFVVIAFDEEDKFAYYKNVPVTNPGVTTTTFTVGALKSKNDTDLYSFVLLANIEEANINQLKAYELSSTPVDKSDVLEALCYTNPDKMGNGTYLAMSSPSTAKVKVVDGLKFNGEGGQQPKISLVRITARIDINVVDAIKNSFRVKEVKLYDFNNAGRIWTSTLNTSTLVTTPAIPGSAERIKGPVEVTLTSGAQKCESQLYMFESEKANNGCIVVGLERSDDNGSTWSSTVEYFKMTFTKEDSGAFKPFDVVRNHRYIFNIEGVKSNGFIDPEDAYNSTVGGMDVTVIDWEDVDVPNVVTDGIFFLGVNQMEFEFGRSAIDYSGQLIIKTNFYQSASLNGWKITSITDTDGSLLKDDGVTPIDNAWFKLEALSGAVAESEVADGKKFNVGFELTENNSGANRTAEFVITAGNLDLLVTVTQTNDAEFYVKIYEVGTDQSLTEVSALDFIQYYNNSLAKNQTKTIEVHWSPVSADLKINLSMLGGTFVFDTSNNSDVITEGTLASDGTGKKRLVITPKEYTNTSGDEFFQNKILTTFVLESEGKVRSSSLTFRQYEAVADVLASDIYLLDGKTQSYTVKSTVGWTAYYVSQEVISGFNKIIIPTMGGASLGGTMVKVGSGGYNLPEGSVVNFSVLNEMALPVPEVNAGKGTVVIVADDVSHGSGYFDNIYADLNCVAAKYVEWSNCYMVDNSKAEKTPFIIGFNLMKILLRPQSGGAFLGTNWIKDFRKLKSQVLWSDIPTLTGDNAVVKSTVYQGTTIDNSMLIIAPGAGAGNAGVILYEDNDGNGIYNSDMDVIRWSWHIWNTDYFPYVEGTYPGENPQIDVKGSGSNTRFMTRHVGAMSEEPGNIDTFGFMYQWGRKDPMPPPPAVSGSWPTGTTVNKPVYFANGSGVTFKEIVDVSSEYNNLVNSINNPMTRFYDPIGYHWWYTNGGNRVGIPADLWCRNGYPSMYTSPEGKGKSVYDPCPVGFRVPNMVDYGSTAKWLSGVGKDPSYPYGQYNEAVGGYYPAMGSRNNSDFSLQGAGEQGTVWVREWESFLLLFTYETRFNTNHYCGWAMGLRCVAED